MYLADQDTAVAESLGLAATQDHPGVADMTLHQELTRETSRELLRHIGFALAGIDPTIHKGA